MTPHGKRHRQIRRSVLTLARPSPSVVYCNGLEGITPSSWSEDWGRPGAAVGLGQLLAFIATTLVSALGRLQCVIVAQLLGRPPVTTMQDRRASFPRTVHPHFCSAS